MLEVLVHAITRVSLSTCLMLDSHGHQHYGGKWSSLFIPSCSHFSFLFRIHVPWYNSSCSHSISYSSTVPTFCVHRGIHKPQISRHTSFLLHPTPPPSNTTSTSIYLPNTFYPLAFYYCYPIPISTTTQHLPYLVLVGTSIYLSQ